MCAHCRHSNFIVPRKRANTNFVRGRRRTRGREVDETNMMWDNSECLKNYIRHTFITCDDTGVCEAVLKIPATVEEKPGSVRLCDGKKYHGSEDEDVNDGSSTSEHSPDIQGDFGHRRRSETSKRLETLKLQRLAQSKVRTVQWRERAALNSLSKATDADWSRKGSTISRNGLEEEDGTFSFSDMNKEKPKLVLAGLPRTSAVSKFIKASSDLPVNPFQGYMKFDGNACLGTSSRRIRIFPLMATSERVRLEPLEVCVTSTAKVCDLIGLICFHYTAKNLFPKLSADISRYALYVAEDTGEVDSDLPPRSPHENVSRFHFPYFALVDHGAPSGSNTHCRTTNLAKKCSIIVHASTGEKFQLEFDSSDTSLRAVRDRALELRFEKNAIKRANLDYNLEKLHEPNRPLPLDSTLSSAGTNEFMLVRIHSARADVATNIPNTVLDHSSTSSSVHNSLSNRFCHLCHSCHQYPVTMIRKFKKGVRVQLILSSDGLEISPDERKPSTSSAAKLFRSFRGQIVNDHVEPSRDDRKTVSFQLKQIGGGEIVEEKAGRKVFRVVHRHHNHSHEWKSHQFEADGSIAEELVTSLNKHLDTIGGELRQEFLKRTPRKASFFKRLQLADLSFGEPGTTSGMIHS